jgi:hypothetical protein
MLHWIGWCWFLIEPRKEANVAWRQEPSIEIG